MKEFSPNYREGYAALELDGGFFRPDSILARDLSVLIAAMQFSEKKSEKTLRWLDLMAGCGVRALRWGLEAVDPKIDKKNLLRDLEVWVNDADVNRADLIQRNLYPLLEKKIPVLYRNNFAKDLLAKLYLDKLFFELVDVDCFGCPNGLLQPIIQILEFNGILILSSTDGRSTTGHDRLGAIRTLSASARTHPASWEIAIRLQLASIARQAWLFGRGVEPLACFSEGRTFRIIVRLKKNLAFNEEAQLGFIARCHACGDQASQSLLAFREWKDCCCTKGSSHFLINGPLWLGPLQSVNVLRKLKRLSDEFPVPISQQSRNLIDRLQFDQGLPLFSWSTNELASRLSLKSQPPLDSLIELLRIKGFQAFRNAVVPGHFRTDASISELLRICEEKVS